MGAPFATPSDIGALLQIDTVNVASAQLCLALAADAVRAEVDQSIDIGTTVERVDGPRKGDHWYESYPAGSVIHVHERPTLAVPTIQEYKQGTGLVTLVEYTDYTWDRSGAIYRIEGGDDDNMIDWTRRRQGIIVTYTHGWSQDSYHWNLAKIVSVQLAARVYVNPEGLHQLDFGGYSTRYRANSELTVGLFELTEHEKTMLKALHGTSLTG